jgi:hypothetical protein
MSVPQTTISSFRVKRDFRSLASVSIVMVLWIASTARSGEPVDETVRIRTLGQPTAYRGEVARKINDLMLYEDRLYLGNGDWFKNTGPTEIVYYDFSQQEFVKEFTVDEEAIVRYRRYGNHLFLPGCDSTESWEFGNLYVRDALGWQKYRTIPRGLHVFDFAEYAGRWYVATASNFGDLKTGPAIGAVYSSEDRGMTWRYEYTTSSAYGTVHRLTALMPYSGRLFAFGYADGPMARESNSEQRRSGDGKQYNRVAESVVHDGVGWFSADIIPANLVQTIEPHVFADHLLLCARIGRYGDQFKNEWRLFAHDGKNTHRVPLECDQIVDTLVKNDRLILLLTLQGKHVLAESTDLAHWSRRALGLEIERPLSVEFDGDSYYLGLADGTVLAATVSAD